MNRRKLLAGLAVAGVLALSPLVSNGAHGAGFLQTISFPMVPSNAAISQCLPHATALVRDTNVGLNDLMIVSAGGLLPSTGYDLFVTNQAAAPFGPSWYQSD